MYDPNKGKCIRTFRGIKLSLISQGARMDQSSFSPPLPRESTKAAFVCQAHFASFSERNWAQQQQIGGHERQQLQEFLLHLPLSLHPIHQLRPANHKASSLRWCYAGRFATSIFSATKRCNVETMLQLFEIMLQRCVALKIVVANRPV